MITCQIDTSGLMAAQRIFNDYSRKTPAQSLNRTVLFILRDVQKTTPFATMSRIDTDMQVTTTPRISKVTGRQVSRNTRNPNIVTVTEGGMATRIVLARLHYGSRYNVRTDHRYWINQQLFSRGQGQAGFWKKVEQVAIRMVKARHSSMHFFQSTWGVIIRKLLPNVPSSMRAGIIPGFGAGSDAGLGEATAAKEGGVTCSCIIENFVGTSGAWPNIDARRNAYLNTVMGALLQAAIDREFESKMAYAAKQGWLDQQSALAVAGWQLSA